MPRVFQSSGCWEEGRERDTYYLHMHSQLLSTVPLFSLSCLKWAHVFLELIQIFWMRGLGWANNLDWKHQWAVNHVWTWRIQPWVGMISNLSQILCIWQSQVVLGNYPASFLYLSRDQKCPVFMLQHQSEQTLAWGCTKMHLHWNSRTAHFKYNNGHLSGNSRITRIMELSLVWAGVA